MTVQHGEISNQETRRLFFLLSGEHQTLPFSELRSIFEAEGHKYRVSGTLGQVMCVVADADCIESVVRRAALARVCCAEILCVEAKASTILRRIRSARFDSHARKGASIAVRVRRVGKSASDVDSMDLERKIGAIILDKVAETRVNLTNPDLTFLGILTGNKFIFGLKLAEILPKPFVERRPRRRPFFHPSAMPAKLARCMANLARSQADEMVLDPFCGTGTFLVEAGLIGCRVVGSDAQKRMIKGSMRNLLHYHVNFRGMVKADAQYLPFREVDRIVTDPPYGRSASTLGQDVRSILRGFLPEARRVIPRGKCLCVAFPKGIKMGKMVKEAGFKLVESHFVYVHRSLTREIAVLERA